MNRLLAMLSAMLVALTASTAATAHSLDDLEAMLGDREAYFQPLDKPAPEFALQDASGKLVHLSDLRGKVVVLHFIYASCPDICPLHAERIAEIQEMINLTPMKDQVAFVTITTDPKNDVAEVLLDYGPAHRLDAINWMFLTTTPDQPEDATRRLAERFGHRFTLTEDGYQVHSVVTHVIDQEGRWRANFHGLRFDPLNLVLFVNGLVNSNAPHPHTEPDFWDKVRDMIGW